MVFVILSIAIQRGTNRIFIDDVGVLFEEINESHAGCNYGWPITEGYTNDPRFCSPLFTLIDIQAFHLMRDRRRRVYNPPIRNSSQYLGKYSLLTTATGGLTS
jgi:hypothetical protein